MLDIKNKINQSVSKFIEDAISSSPDLGHKLDNISPILFSLRISGIEPFFIRINKNIVNVSMDEVENINFLISIGVSEVAQYITSKTIEKKHIEGDEEKAFVLINILKNTDIDFSILIERNFGHLPSVLSYLAGIKINQNSDVTIMPDDLSQKLRSISIRLDRLEALNNEN